MSARGKPHSRIWVAYGVTPAHDIVWPNPGNVPPEDQPDEGTAYVRADIVDELVAAARDAEYLMVELELDGAATDNLRIALANAEGSA